MQIQSQTITCTVQKHAHCMSFTGSKICAHELVGDPWWGKSWPSSYSFLFHGCAVLHSLLLFSFCFHSGEFPSALSSFDSTFASETNIYYCLASHAKVEESFVENPAHEGIQNPDTAQSVKLNEHLVWIINYGRSPNNPETHFRILWSCQYTSDVEKMCHSCAMTQGQQCYSGTTGSAYCLFTFCATLAPWINVHRSRPRSMQTWLRRNF